VTIVETGFPGSPKNGTVRPCNFSEHHRLARLNANASEQEPGVERSQYLFDQIVLAHGNPAADQQQIALEALA